MNSKKERKHKIKQADTLEASRKALQKAVMGVLRNGGFLFSRSVTGHFVPVIVNARISDFVSAAISFVVSRARTREELSDLKDYVIKALDHVCALREKDIDSISSERTVSPEELAAVIAEAEKSQQQ